MNQDNNLNNGYNQNPSMNNQNINYNQPNYQNIPNNNQNYNLSSNQVNQNLPENNNKKEPKKSNNVLLILFMLISLLLAGYIVYDKVIKKEEIKEPEKIEKPVVEENNELVKFDESQLTEKDNITEDGKEYFKVLTYKNNELTVDFKLYTEKGEKDYENGYDDKIKLDLYINGLKKDNQILEEYVRCTDVCENLGEYAFADITNKWVSNIKKLIGTIKGDKYYFYIDLPNKESSIYLINEKGIILNTNDVKFYAGTNLELTQDCQTFEYAVAEDNARYGTKFFRDDAIYFLKLSKMSEDATVGDLTNEYKVTIENDKVNIIKINTCHAFVFGNKMFEEDYEDM